MSTPTISIPTRPPRKLLSDHLEINSWEQLEPYFEDLKGRPIESVEDLEAWLRDRSELEAVLEEDMAWRYIRMNVDTTDADLAERFRVFVQEIEPKIAPYSNEFDKKLVGSPLLTELKGQKYHIHFRKVKKDIEIYRDENIPLQAELQTESQKFGSISANMTVEVDGQELTMQAAANFLKNPDRQKREEVFQKMKNRRLQDRDALDDLFDSLLAKRQQVAENADFPNFRDYMFTAMGRFDYTVQDCYDFHDSIRNEILPIVARFNEERQALLQVNPLRPWDMDVDPQGKDGLKPFSGGKELLDRSVKCFSRIRPFYGECLAVMGEMGHLDLDSKKGKAPGGFNYPLFEIGVPFIYMNATGSFRDVVTMVHEGGHAIHSFLSRGLELTAFKQLTSEVAELASMSMELISMEYWDEFFPDPEELRRAKKEQLTKIISLLPWIAQVDAFQHWIYENPNHTREERYAHWKELSDGFSIGLVDWSGEEVMRSISWQRQLHIFEVPFYYIEYGMAQLGAIAIWRNYKNDPELALNQYEAALKLGYTQSIGDIYQTAGVKFDFSGEYVRELAEFVQSELDKL